jgi:hypothetical protein
MKLRFIVSATLVVCVAFAVCSIPAAAQRGNATAVPLISHPNGPEAFSKVKPMTAEEHEMIEEKMEALHEAMARQKGQVALGPQVHIPGVNRETTLGAMDELVSPSSFYIGSGKAYTGVGDGESTVAEPAIANSGEYWWVTQNWSRGYSLNAGNTWTIIPDDAGPSDAPNFCCDQDAVHDHGRNVSIWEELFVDSGLTTGVIRIHVVNAANTGDACTIDLNGGAGVLYDYPHLGLGNNFLYVSANGLTNGSWTGAIMWRYNLDEVATCAGSISGSVFTWTGSVGQVVWVPARNVTDTQYMVTVENGSQNRYFVWPENSGTINYNVLNSESVNYGAATCTGGTGSNNWLQFDLSTSSIGFQTRTAVGQDGSSGNPPAQYLATYIPVIPNGTGRPQAYEAGSIVGTDHILTASAIDSGADIFNSGTCFSYGDVTANSRGDLGLIIGFGGSTTGGSAAQSVIGISDDYSRGTERGYFSSIYTCAGANENPTRWGDYLTARVQEPVDVAFIAAGFGDVGGVGKVEICEFMRGRYEAAFLERQYSH